MFSTRSRYRQVVTDQVILPDGRKGMVVRFPLRRNPQIEGYHARLHGQRLDHIAAYYLKDPTAFWRLCDANGSISPDALASREHIAVPKKET